MAFENGQDQPPQRLVGNVGLGERFQLGEHRLGVMAGMLHELGLVEAVGRVRVRHRADVVQLVDLWAELLVVPIDSTDLVELALLPVALTVFEPWAVGPDHEGHGPEGVAEAGRVVRLAVAGHPLNPLGEGDEAISELAWSHLAEPDQRWFRSGHGKNLLSHR